MKKYKTARIHSFESMAALDGEGLRYAVFFCGCPLRCVYCHNPDTWNARGTEYTTRALIDKISRFKPYFRNRGGVTFSGGEPLLNAPFINELSPMLKEEGIAYCLDTSGGVPLTKEVEGAIDNADSIILDLKFYDKKRYECYTSGDFSLLLKFGDYCTRAQKQLRLRTVVVPGINDSADDIREYAALAGRFSFERYELLGFHTMGFFKYEKAGIKNPLGETPALSPDRLRELQTLLDSLI